MAIKNFKGIPIVYDKENRLISSMSFCKAVGRKVADRIGLRTDVDEMMPAKEAIGWAQKARTPAAMKLIRWINVELLDKPSNPDYARVKMILENECHKIEACRAAGRHYPGRWTKYKYMACVDDELSQWEERETEDYLDYVEGENGKEYSILDYYHQTRGWS